MCGRYVLKSTIEELKQAYGAVPAGVFELSPNYNVAPTAEMPVVLREEDADKIRSFRWGLVPFWADGPDSGYSMINARAESVHQKKSYRKPFHTQRCIVPANGFYEWKKTSSGKVPHFIYSRQSDLMNLAGLYTYYRGESGTQKGSFTIITTRANSVVESLHDRMPAMLLPEEFEYWLDPGNSDIQGLRKLLHPWPDDDTDYYTVSKEVNNTRNNGSLLIEPATSA
jgi:putative SOS response-associated peptidase YedK